MKPTIIEQCRAALSVAALAAVLIQLVVFIAILALGVSQDVFTSPAFRLGVVIVVAGAVYGVRRPRRKALYDPLLSRQAR
jgi:glycerol uptake facilitator-like aquaporin